jgi:hypothetical protein
MVYFFSVEIMASSSQVRFEVLRGLVDAILSELS